MLQVQTTSQLAYQEWPQIGVHCASIGWLRPRQGGRRSYALVRPTKRGGADHTGRCTAVIQGIDER